MKPTKLQQNFPCLVLDFLNLTSRGQLREAVNTLPLLASKGITLNSKTIASLIQQCANTKSIREGRLIHTHLMITVSKHPNTLISNYLINMYAKCGEHVKARDLFDKMHSRNLYSWNTMLSGYAHLGMLRAAKKLFDKMPYKDFVSWNTMVMAYVESKWFNEALKLYKEFRRLDNGFNEYSFAGVLTACIKLRDLWLAKQLHCQVFIVGFLPNVVLSSSVIDAYAKCGELGDARRLFDEMIHKDVQTWTMLVSRYAQSGDMISAQEIFDIIPEKNLVTWNALIAGYAHNGMGHYALKLFTEMIIYHIEPDHFTFSSCLLACATQNSLEMGRQIHAHLITANIRLNIVVLSSLIDMYSKCGNLEAAKRVFHTVQNKEHVVLWNTFISALAHHGCGKRAIKIFTDMVRLGLKPESVTFLVILNACSHSGLVQEGLYLFESMISKFRINPDQEHYACLIDLLGQSRCFDLLIDRLKKMPFKPDERVWNALLGVCRIHGNVEFGRLAARHLIELEPQSPIAYLLLSSIYAALGRWDSAQEVRRLMNERCVVEEKVLSWLEIDRMLHLDTLQNKLHHGKKKKTFVLELLAEQSLKGCAPLGVQDSLPQSNIKGT